MINDKFSPKNHPTIRPIRPIRPINIFQRMFRAKSYVSACGNNSYVIFTLVLCTLIYIINS